MKKRQFIADYLTFSRKDRIGVIVLICLILIIFLLPRWFDGSSRFSPIKVDSTLLLALDTLQSKPEGQAANAFSERRADGIAALESAGSHSPFIFDPNTLSEEGWRRLGVSAKTARTITHYLAKGGHFYKPEDVKRIWGLDEAFYSKVSPYIRIAAKKIQSDAVKGKYPINERTDHKARIEDVDINTADTADLIALPGIGSKLANRIIHFRTRLGGFTSADQIAETYGLPDSTFQRLRSHFLLGHTSIQAININTASKEILKAHPYIGWNLANAIVEYRNQHGPFQKMEDLRNIHLVTDDVYKKLTPYLSLQ